MKSIYELILEELTIAVETSDFSRTIHALNTLKTYYGAVLLCVKEQE
jgi:hypothetical protein